MAATGRATSDDVSRIHSPGSFDRRPTATRFFEWADAPGGHELVLTSVVPSEDLVGFPRERQDAVASRLSRTFAVIPHDAAAAKIAAKLISDREFTAGLQDATGAARSLVKAHIMIAASAIGRVDRLVTCDDAMKAVCRKLGIPSLDPADIESQRGLFNEQVPIPRRSPALAMNRAAV